MGRLGRHVPAQGVEDSGEGSGDVESAEEGGLCGGVRCELGEPGPVRGMVDGLTECSGQATVLVVDNDRAAGAKC
ncbi:hypothetical protein [Streptomyces sp. NPDC051219]|uniref:hypothetical protein n=1 Tax=Streptomyces sp. NPDC051219 TaxID=3155283 RepID=UPI00343A46AC